MADAYVGQGVTRELRIEDTGGVPVTDATVLYTLTSPAGAALVTAQTATHTGDGWYAYSVSGSLLPTPGWYAETWSGTSGAIALPWHTGFGVDYADGPVVARWEVRHQAAALNGDLWLGTAESGTALTLVDSDRTLEPDHFWRGAWLTLYGGPGRGQERQLSDSTKSSGTLTWAKAMGPLPAASTRYELHKLFSADDYNRMINAAIDALGALVTVPMTDESVLLTDDTTIEYAIPAEMEWVRGIATRDTSNSDADWQWLSPYRGDYELVRGRRTLRLKAPATDLRLRLIGDRRPPRVERDAAFVPVNPTYLAHAANALLWQSKVVGPALDSKAAALRAKAFVDQANALLPIRRPGKGARRV